jgi:hypothetical protein
MAKEVPDNFKFNLTPKDIVFLLTFLSGFLAQWYSLKIEIHDAIVESKYEKEFSADKFLAITKRLDLLDFKITNSQNSPANKPKRISLETETEID